MLFIDNCFVHGVKEMLGVLQLVEVNFLRPENTSRIQSLKCGIMAPVKDKLRRHLLFQIFDNIDSGKKPESIMLTYSPQ